MRNQKGATVIQVLIVVAIIGMIAAIAIPTIQMAREHNQGIADFKVFFGVDLPPGDLSPDQKTVLRPFVSQKLGELWTAVDRDNQTLRELIKLPATQDPAEVQKRLEAVSRASVASQTSQDNFTRAQFAAKLRELTE